MNTEFFNGLPQNYPYTIPTTRMIAEEKFFPPTRCSYGISYPLAGHDMDKNG
jgi:hypothetical protein